MELNLTPKQQALIEEAAARTGRSRDEVVGQAIDWLLDYDQQLAGAVERGRAAARRGEVLEHEAVGERLERRFRS